ncbi:hypothetical protein HY632_04400, partial [Candidatus Uhrbacteria bacterium]|nr:hypothetical protein [Candidatus Uhrbacteria bacterium]
MLQRLLTERRWGMVLGVSAVGFSGFFLFAFGVFWSTPDPLFAAAPNFTGTTRTPTDGQQSVLIDAAVEIHSSVQLAPASVNAWAAVTSGTSQHLRGVAVRPFGSSGDAVAVGRSGSIRYTTNGGTSWTAVNTGGFFSDLNAVACSPGMNNASTCVAVGDAGDDGSGNTVGGIVFAGVGVAGTGGYWNTPNTYAENASVTLLGVAVPDDNTAYAVGTGGVIYKTTNGGSQWTALTSGTATTLNDIACYSTTDCVAVGNAGLTLVTSNGGQSWSAGSAGSWSMYGVSATDTSNTYLAVGADADIWKTTDGGFTWSEISPGSLVTTFRSIFCLDASVCIAAGTSGVIMRTANGGTSWVRENNASTTDLYGITGNQNFGVGKLVVGDSGVMLTPQLTNVQLRANTGNTQAGAPTGANLCTSVSVGVGNAGTDTKISCAHGSLSSGTWYTLTVTGGTSGLRSTTNETMTSDVTVTFQTAPNITIATQPTDLGVTAIAPGESKAVIGFAITTMDNSRLQALSVKVAGTTTASAITAVDLVTDTANTSGDALSDTIDDYASGSPSDSSSNDDRIATQAGSGMTMGSNFTLSVSSNAHTANKGRFPVFMAGRGTYEYFVVLRLASSAASGGTMVASLNSATCATSGGESTVPCTVTSVDTGTITISGGGSPLIDSTPPDLPTNLSLFSTDGGVHISWVDPSDADLASVHVLRMDGERTELRGSVAPSVHAFTDRGTDLIPDATYAYALQVTDTTGNRAIGPSKTVKIIASPLPSAVTSETPVRGLPPPTNSPP